MHARREEKGVLDLLSENPWRVFETEHQRFFVMEGRLFVQLPQP